MRRVLVVGDPHATADELDDCAKLVEYVIATAIECKADEVLFLGDLYHTHALMHVEVMSFWRRSFIEIVSETDAEVVVLVGNHDMPGNESSSAHALLAHADQEYVTVISSPFAVGGVAYVPYQSDGEKLVEHAKRLGGKTLVCHATFDGSMFENGFYAKDGVDSNLLPQEAVLSGHIHAPQSFGKVWYPGAPRWRTLSDANTKRAIWAVDFDDDGRILEKTPFSMGGVCREIAHVVDTPESAEALSGFFDPTVDFRVDIKGPAAFVEERKRGWAQAAPRARVRTFVTDTRVVKVRESEGIPKAFQRFLAGFQSKNGTDPNTLQAMAAARLGWT